MKVLLECPFCGNELISDIEPGKIEVIFDDVEAHGCDNLYAVLARADGELHHMWKLIEMKYISLEDCEENGVYEVDGRNFSLAVFRGGKFFGKRYKFGHSFVDSEEHFETGPPHGTVKPLRKIGSYAGDIYEFFKEVKCTKKK